MFRVSNTEERIMKLYKSFERYGAKSWGKPSFSKQKEEVWSKKHVKKKEINNPDEDMTSTNAWSTDPIQVSIGPLTRAHAKRFKNALSGLVQNIRAQACTWRPVGGDEWISKPITSLIQV
ncbi:hypothetical protein PanWU01x14_236470 [Parasponia andersonii]|uniref:Uncharacterized protein n=1 Tax=Parasponia andersonii TaxID=3476 RepID=A0A2P5BIC7_PARAD|nr:hypothetical protein PanWU01x14_236470 [Parasponia andersonii]